MKKIVRWNPTREISSLWNTFDRMLEDSYRMPTNQVRNWGLAIDVAENDNAYVVKASVPGVDPENIEVLLATRFGCDPRFPFPGLESHSRKDLTPRLRLALPPGARESYRIGLLPVPSQQVPDGPLPT